MNTVIYMGHAMPMKVSADYLSYRTNTRSFVGFSNYIPRSMISKKRLAPYLRGQKIDKSLFLAEKFRNYKGI